MEFFYYDTTRMKSRRKPKKKKLISGKGSSNSAPLEGDHNDYVFFIFILSKMSYLKKKFGLPILQHDKTTSSSCKKVNLLNFWSRNFTFKF